MSTARSDAGSNPLLRGAGPVLLALTAVGVVTFAAGLLLGMPWSLAVWQAVHINFLYVMGLAFAGVLISVIFELTSSGWGQNVKRLAEASVGLVPLALLTFVGVVLGHHAVAHDLYDHDHFAHMNAAKQIWLAPGFLLTRDGLAVLLLAGVSMAFVYHSLRPRLGQALRDGRVEHPTPTARWIARRFGSLERESARSERTKQILAPIVVICYALVLTLIAFDQIMSLDTTWVSTLFGAYFFITNLYLGWATLSATAVLARNTRGAGAFAAYGRGIRVDDLHDLGKLTFAFCMLSADFFWSQFVVIWYGNLPEETPFVVRRVYMEPWSDLAWAVAFLCYALPFVLLLFKRVKRTDVTLVGVTIAVMVMIWVERFLLVAPSVWRADIVGEEEQYLLPVFALSLGVTLGVVGLAGLFYRWALGTVLMAPISAPGAAGGHHAPTAKHQDDVVEPAPDVDDAAGEAGEHDEEAGAHEARDDAGEHDEEAGAHEARDDAGEHDEEAGAHEAHDGAGEEPAATVKRAEKKGEGADDE